jgi:hypothetical protein
VIPYGCTYWAANYNNRRPTPIDGVWNVVEKSSELAASEIPSVIFFEHNAAHMVVFKFGPENYVEHDFRVDPQLKTITIADVWLRGGKKLFDGKYELTADRLTLNGRFSNHDAESTVQLLRRH